MIAWMMDAQTDGKKDGWKEGTRTREEEKDEELLLKEGKKEREGKERKKFRERRFRRMRSLPRLLSHSLRLSEETGRDYRTIWGAKCRGGNDRRTCAVHEDEVWEAKAGIQGK